MSCGSFRQSEETQASSLVESGASWAWPLSLNAPVVRRFFELFEKYGGFKSGKLKLKKPKQLQVEDFCLFLTIPLFVYDSVPEEYRCCCIVIIVIQC